MESVDSQTFVDQLTQFLSQSGESLADLVSRLNFFILLPIFFAVGAFLLGYFRNYQQPATRIRQHLTDVVEQIRTARFKHKQSPEDLESALNGIFTISSLKPLWSEYCASLHVVQGRDHTRTILATAPAETFFTKEAVVDLHINADFYRHLPGILTGIGIIGTFSGLVWGLHQFKPDSSDALSSLPLLLQEVTSAFIGSGFAILAAIFVTYKEKSVLNSCYRAVGDLNREVDSLYATGAGEEYLARLVVAGEGSLAAQQNQTQQIAAAIKEALAAPMAELAGVVTRVTANQEVVINSILTEVLKTFTIRLNDTFSSQIDNINRSFEKSTAAMEQVQQSMTVLLGDMAEVGVTAVDQMSGTLAASIETASVAQDKMNDQLRAFVEELRETLLKSQNQSSEIMDVAMRAVLSKLQAAITRLGVDRAEQIEHDKERLEKLTVSVARLIESVDKSSTRTAESLGILQNTASGAISGMNNGAVVMRMAADRFTMAGNTLSEALDKSEKLTNTVDHLEDLLASVVQLRRAG